MKWTTTKTTKRRHYFFYRQREHALSIQLSYNLTQIHIVVQDSFVAPSSPKEKLASTSTKNLFFSNTNRNMFFASSTNPSFDGRDDNDEDDTQYDSSQTSQFLRGSKERNRSQQRRSFAKFQDVDIDDDRRQNSFDCEHMQLPPQLNATLTTKGEENQEKEDGVDEDNNCTRSTRETVSADHNLPSHRRQGTGRNSPEVFLLPEDVLGRIERLIELVLNKLHQNELPELTTMSFGNNHDDNGDNDTDNDEDETRDETRNSGRRNTTIRNTSHSTTRVVSFHNLAQGRKFTSILLVLSFCYTLLLSQRTTTTREVYYFYVTHFRSQKECDQAIVDATNLLQIPRSSLGLFASPKGWYCGCIQILQQGQIVLDGRALSSIQGTPVTQEWLKPASQRGFTVDCRATTITTTRNSSTSASYEKDYDNETAKDRNHDQGHPTQGCRRAKCILVIEKEGVYNRLSEDRLYDQYPCILVTGKGFPDLATRSLVHTLHHELNLPVYGVADCNPYGVLVLQTYQCGSLSRGVDGGARYSVPVQWLGLRPSHVAKLQSQDSRGNNNRHSGNNNVRLPPDVYQHLTELDKKRLDQLLNEDHSFHSGGTNDDPRYDELEMMESNGYKVELEALNWLGMFCMF